MLGSNGRFHRQRGLMSEKRRIVVNTLANGVAQFAALISALVFT